MKKTLLALCAGVLAISASAQHFKVGEALSYHFGPDFSWFAGDDTYAAQNANWPFELLENQASLAGNYGMGAVWFNNNNGKFTTCEAANAYAASVADPWNDGEYVIKVQTKNWDGFGNFNFALPQANEVCRIRMIYRVDPTGVENQWYKDDSNVFNIRMTKEAQDQCFKKPMYAEPVRSYWDEQGWRVVDLYYELTDAKTYLAMTFMPGGLTCQRNVPFYLKEVSIVPVSKLAGDTHVSGEVNYEIVQECPELVVVDGEDSINEISAVAEKAAEGIYDLQGRKVAKAAHGLYIINGVKTLVK